jgi:hypothetical protein
MGGGFVIPGRRVAASPESSKPPPLITGFRALGLRFALASPRNDVVDDSNLENVSLKLSYRSDQPLDIF